MKLEFSRQIFEKVSNIKFHHYQSSGSRVVPCGETETDRRNNMTDLTVAFRNFANAPRNECRNSYRLARESVINAHKITLLNKTQHVQTLS